MKILIWLACVLAYSVVVTLLRTQGIFLGGIPTVLLALVLVFLPAPFLCKWWEKRQKSRGARQAGQYRDKCKDKSLCATPFIQAREKLDRELADGAITQAEHDERISAMGRPAVETAVKKPAKNQLVIGLSIAIVALVICSCVLGYKVWEFRNLAITFIEENDRLLEENKRLETEISAMQSGNEKASSFLRGMAERRAQSVDAEYGSGAYGGTEWTFGDRNYVASASSDKYHRTTCNYVDFILEENRVYFETEDEAVSAGKSPCSVCNP